MRTFCDQFIEALSPLLGAVNEPDSWRVGGMAFEEIEAKAKSDGFENKPDHIFYFWDLPIVVSDVVPEDEVQILHKDGVLHSFKIEGYRP